MTKLNRKLTENETNNRWRENEFSESVCFEKYQLFSITCCNFIAFIPSIPNKKTIVLTKSHWLSGLYDFCHVTVLTLCYWLEMAKRCLGHWLWKDLCQGLDTPMGVIHSYLHSFQSILFLRIRYFVNNAVCLIFSLLSIQQRHSSEKS